MLTSFSEFKFFQSFRIPVLKADELRCFVEVDDTDNATDKERYIEDARLVDISVTGLGFKTKERMSVGKEINFSLQFKKIHLDLTGKIVRAFSMSVADDEIIYGVEVEETPKLKKLIETYISSFSLERMQDCLTHAALQEGYAKASDGFEVFSLLLSLFKDITQYGDKEGFVQTMLEEVVRILNAQRASIFLINPQTNELEAIAALGVEKDTLKFDYRMGIAGSVYTTGVALNINTEKDQSRYNKAFDDKFGFKTRSIICYPIKNSEDKNVGVIEVINKRNQDQFTIEDEKTMKVLSLVFSSVFHQFNPISDHSQIRRFSTPFDREFAMIGRTPHVTELRASIVKTKDLDSPLMVSGEMGVGKTLYGKILHSEGKRGLHRFELIDCSSKDLELLELDLFGTPTSPARSKFSSCDGGTVLLCNVSKMPIIMQRKLLTMLEEKRIPESNMSVNVRLISTITDDLSELIEKGEFDRTLGEYLASTYIHIEPLRKRVDDVPHLVAYFLKMECKRQGLLLKTFSPETLDKLTAYNWVNNIQELKVAVERAVSYNPKSHVISDVVLESPTLPLVDLEAKRRLFGDIPHVYNIDIPLKDRLALIEREMIFAEIKRLGGNKSHAAKAMGISREALRKKLILAEEVLAGLENRAPRIAQEDDGVVVPLKKAA